MARAKTKSDEIYNARRRYRRQAQRFLEQSKRTKNKERRKELKNQAREAIENAVSTYSGSRNFGIVAEIAKTLNVTRDFAKPKSALDKLVKASFDVRYNEESDRREKMAKSILSVGNVGSRFYGGLVQIWDVDMKSKKNKNQAIIKFFGARDLLEVIEMFQDEGIDLYSPTLNEEIYKSIQLKIAEMVLQNKYGSR